MRRSVLAAIVLLFTTAVLTGADRDEGAAPVDPEMAKVVHGLAEKLRHPSFEVREGATFALMKLGPEARPAVESEAEHTAMEVRRRLKRVLLHYTEVERLAGLAEADPSNWPMLKRGPGRGASSGAAAIRDEPKILWTRDLPFGLGSPYFDSPLLADETHLYIASRTGRVAALDRATGEIAWIKSAGEQTFAAPALSAGTLYIPGRSLTAMDTRTGNIRWKWATDYGVSASPVVHGGNIYVVEKGEKLVCLNPAGEVQWRTRVAATSSPPMVVGELVIVGAEDGVKAFSIAGGTRRWSYDTESPVTTAPATLGDTILVSDSGRTIYSLTADRGRLRWQRRIPEGTVLESPVVYGDTVLFATDGASFRAISGIDGSDRWSRFIGMLVQSSPCVAGGIVYFSGGSQLHAMLCSDGDDVWRLNVAAGLLASPILLDGTMHVVTRGGLVLALK